MLVYPNCKINFGLYITDKRSDGFHNLQTVFYPVNLCDTLEVNEIPDSGDKVKFTQTGIALDCDNKSNICIKAYDLLNSDFNLPPVTIRLHKNIPSGAGLGGGSSDAAYTLKCLNLIFNLGLTDENLENYAKKLGSDCAFFIRNKPVYATGRGDQFINIELSSLKDLHIVIIKPKVHISTIEAYKNIKPSIPTVSLREQIKKPVEVWKSTIGNDFENYVFTKHPEVENIKKFLYSKGAIFASMSGSGSAVFGIFKKLPLNLNTDPSIFIWKQ
ncbi:MAG: 4-(cytidine 5'-diphospho)-2-C-methyl-D-erythritol kinase [Bacteroidota bacterium]|nr:4-(cytidine 5'-diphospho)-2-C-methyl-D-erythritol kinase [Bacteroidota bacterium]